MREPQVGQARGRMGLIAHSVARLCAWCAVIAQAIGLRDQAQLWPVEVNPEPGDLGLGARLVEPGAARDRQESSLEL
jgi:hypothetical protein